MSPNQADPGREARSLAKGRLEALTDGVFAIAITLLVIEIPVPSVEPGESLARAILDQWPSYGAYTVTFFLVGAYWVNHHRMFTLLKGVNHTFLLLNVVFLMAIAIIPFPNALLAEYTLEPQLRSVAAAVYGLAMLALAILFNVVWWYAGGRGRLMRDDCDDAKVRKVLNSYLIGPILYLTGVILALVQPIASLVLYFLIPLGYLVEGPVKDIAQGYRETDA